jgi:hypothetical protein
MEREGKSTQEKGAGARKEGGCKGIEGGGEAHKRGGTSTQRGGEGWKAHKRSGKDVEVLGGVPHKKGENKLIFAIQCVLRS